MSSANGVATCRNCGAKLAPCAPYCSVCGAAVYNRAGIVAAADSVGSDAIEDPNRINIPGFVKVSPYEHKPLVAPTPDTDFDAVQANVSIPGAGRRLGAKILDLILPAIVMSAGAVIGALTIKVTRVNSDTVTLNLVWFVVALGSAILLSAGYWIWMWVWEAKQGKTLGNLILGLRTTNLRGLPAGMGAILIRNLLLTIAYSVAFVGGIFMSLSSAWDANGKRQGWHDKAAKTLVFNVRSGRNPLLTGGIDGPAKFRSAPMPERVPVQLPGSSGRRSSPAPAHAQVRAEQAPRLGQPGQPAQPSQAAQPNSFAFVAGPASAEQPPPVQSFRPSTAPAEYEPSAETVLRRDIPAVAPAQHLHAEQPSFVLHADDGSTYPVEGFALIGRNPSASNGGNVSALISLPDQSRSVSKTHAQLRCVYEGVYVSDFASTNGSWILRANGDHIKLSPGAEQLAQPGDAIKLGDRTLLVSPQ